MDNGLKEPVIRTPLRRLSVIVPFVGGTSRTWPTGRTDRASSQPGRQEGSQPRSGAVGSRLNALGAQAGRGSPRPGIVHVKRSRRDSERAYRK